MAAACVIAARRKVRHPNGRRIFRHITTAITAVAWVLLAACTEMHHADRSQTEREQDLSRAQLSVGYSLLYGEADGMNKLKWILRFKDKPEEVGQVINDLVAYYEQLAENLRSLSKQFPALRLDAKTMPDIVGEERKAMGAEMAKEMAPVVGKSGVEFEREALLNFRDALNEQRHLVGVMIAREKVSALKEFLETTKGQLDARYAKIEALLERRYFTH